MQMTTEELVGQLATAQKTIETYELLVDELTSDEDTQNLVAKEKIHRMNRIARAQSSLTLNLDELNSSTGIFFSDFEEFDPTSQRSILRLLKQFHDLVTASFKQHNLPL